MSSSPSKPESSFRKSFRKWIDRLIEPKPSGQTTPAQAPSAHSPSPHPIASPDPNAGAPSGLPPAPVPPTPRLSTPAPATPARASSPAPSTSPPAKSAAQSPSALTPKHTQAASPTGVWAVLDTSLRALHKNTAMFPLVHSAVGSVLDCIDVMQQLSKNHDEREELASELTRLSNLIVRHMEQSNSSWVSDTVDNVARGIEEQVRIIESQRSRGTGWRLFEASTDEELISKCYRRIGSLFRELQADASMSIWNVVNEQAADARLYQLAPVHIAKYDSTLSTSISRRTCTANTRTAILSGLNHWSHDPAQADIYWMNGMAGTGKTTIAGTFCESLRQREWLAASFFCTRTVPECRAATRILPTIAYQLARYSPQFRSALCESLQEDPDVSTANLTRQFDLLLKEPLTKVKEAMPNHLVVVIDALDECDDISQVELLLSTLLKSAGGLPLRFFVTSRPEPEIYHRMISNSQGYRQVLHLHAVETSLVQADIELYLQAELAPMAPLPTEIQELVQRSGTLFIYAATLVRYIQPNKPHTNPKGRLQSVLSMTRVSASQYAAIDALYRSVLDAALNEQGPGAVEVEGVRRVLHTVVCAQEPLPIETLTEIAKMGDEAHTLAALEPLRAVLYVSESSGLVSTLHASFPDFLFDQGRSQLYHCDSSTFGEVLAQRCFEVMKSQLRFNMCGLESSFVPDSQVANLDEAIAKAVSQALWYACQYWADHLEKAKWSGQLCSELADFLSHRLLFWMEVMSLKRKMGAGLQLLSKAKTWVVSGDISSDVVGCAEDARKFVSSFAANPVSRSTPHIYISALPFCPKSSFVFDKYYPRTRGLLKLTSSALEGSKTAMMASWTVESEVYCIALSPDGGGIAYGCESGVVGIRSATDGILLAGPLEGHTGVVFSVAYSPDGSRIATSSADGTIRIWKAQGGALASGPLKGHSDVVGSVAYCPDGTRIVSGSNDRTIRVWDAQDGILVAGPFEGHTKEVWAVAYSPDGSRIASGSPDKTVRVWNTQGVLVIGPLAGHEDSIRSVAYSPNGAYIASGSFDKTIRVWNAGDGTLVTGPLTGHTGVVRSVAYSLDGSRIISSSSDSTICVWNAQNGTLATDPLKGHTGLVRTVAYSHDGTRIISGSTDSTIRVWDPLGVTSTRKKSDSHTSPVNSVAYSPDGTRIASGSSDNTIRVWQAHNGSLIVGPLEGHTSSVTSVAYSPAGTRIVSGSGDRTIRVWNAHDGALVVGPLEGHTDWVRSVGYSPDGTRIVSGSDDHTIRVWDAEDGTLVAGPLEGHTDCLRSVVYSPDGTHIASGSDDNTIRVWNAHDGTLDVGPLEGHSGGVMSVAYSHDGTRIASGSYETIRVWDAKDGALVAGPFEGHTHWVWSVAYSPDGTRIVSGSWDETIRVWNAEDGTLVAGPLNGHTDWIHSVAYSPDGTSIVSGSDDQTIRVWSARDDVSVSSSQVEGHTDPETIDSIANGASVDSSGWLTASDSRLLLWVPPEVQPRDMLSRLRCQMIIGLADPLFVEYGDLVLGRRWTECYQPR